MIIAKNIKNIIHRIDQACQKVNRNPKDISLIAVSKTVSSEQLKIALDSGITHIGENRIQEAEKKFSVLGKVATWHLIGHLQTNKVKKALQIFDFIHSVDSYYLAEEISRRAVQYQKNIKCFVEVNTSQEPSKFGVEPDKTLELVKRISLLPGIKIEGLMTIGAFLPDKEQVRPCFKMLRDLKEQIQQKGIDSVEMRYLSMGMTNDFEVAIEEGANMIRVGRAIFGNR